MSYFFVFLCFGYIRQRLYKVGPHPPKEQSSMSGAEDFFCKDLNIEFCFVLQFVFYLAWSTYPAWMTDNKCGINQSMICNLNQSLHVISVMSASQH
jgi:hypothetical protein